MDAVTALPSVARGMLDGVTRCIGLILGKGPPFVYPPSWVPTHLRRALGATACGSSLGEFSRAHTMCARSGDVLCQFFFVIVRKIFLAWVSLYVKLFVQHLVCDPEKLHSH